MLPSDWRATDWAASYRAAPTATTLAELRDERFPPGAGQGALTGTESLAR